MPAVSVRTRFPVEGLAAMSLGAAPLGFAGVIRAVGAPAAVAGGLPAAELERRLIELGFVEGARVRVLHQGPIGGDPIAVRVDEATIALRRADAAAILVEPDPTAAFGSDDPDNALRLAAE